ncbi:MAG: hypothetical protein ACJAXH_001311, partial [Colwellia sp.]
MTTIMIEKPSEETLIEEPNIFVPPKFVHLRVHSD